jgi:hypothetical protein
MTGITEACAVCGAGEPDGVAMSRVVIEGRALCLCRDHATTVVAARPETFDELRSLFMGAAADVSALLRLDTVVERRSPIARRAAEDRRAFPPRPEGRRANGGRRWSDPID